MDEYMIDPFMGCTTTEELERTVVDMRNVDALPKARMSELRRSYYAALNRVANVDDMPVEMDDHPDLGPNTYGGENG